MTESDIKENGAINFFSDTPLTIDKERDVRFGHSSIVNSLKIAVAGCPLPFTIGLFGKWGCGKSTILNILRNKLEHVKIATVNFDVWKHEADSLRRTFLEELVKQLKANGYLLESFELSPRLKSPITKEIAGKFRCNWKIILGLFITAVGIGFLLYQHFPKGLDNYLSIVFGGSLISTLFLWILQQTVTSETLTTTLEPFRDPHEFEDEFDKVISNVSSKRLLIIVDNLDRCTHDKAVELLSTIKTFLAKDENVRGGNKCIFLVACDDEAIKKHIESVYIKKHDKENDEKAFSAEEFLRKFFNVYIRIPDFIDTELQTYAEDLLKETRIPEFSLQQDISFIIMTAFRNNPRQIKQFINVLLAHYLLAKEREGGKQPSLTPKGVITDNIAFLAKFLVIRQLFPTEYKTIRENNLNINEMGSIDNKEFQDFLTTTKLIIADDILPFIYLKQSKDELAIPALKELEFDLIKNADEGNAFRNKLKLIKTDPQQVNSLKRFIPALLERNKKRRSPLFNVTSCSLSGFRHHNLELGKSFYNKVATLLNKTDFLKTELQRFEPSLIFKEVLERCRSKEDREGVVTQYISLLSKKQEPEEVQEISIEYAYSLCEELLEHSKWLNEENKQNITKALEELYYTSMEILSLFEDKKEFITGVVISKFVSTFSSDDVENIQGINNKVELLLKFKKIITGEVTKNIVTCLHNLQSNENQKPYDTRKENLLSRIEEIFKILTKEIADIDEKSILSSFANDIIQGINGLSDWAHKKIFLFTCLKLVDMLNDPLKANFSNLIQQFLLNANIDSLVFVLNKVTKSEKEKLLEQYTQQFGQRAIQDQAMFDLLYSIATPNVRMPWMIDLINAHTVRALGKLEELKYKVDDKIKVVDTLLEAATRVPIQEKDKVYNAINEMKCANDVKLRNKLIGQIKALLIGADMPHQEIGYSALQGAHYISATVKRETSRETIEWLRTLEPSNAGQVYAVKSVVINWVDMETAVKSHYADFVFDKLIKRSPNVDSIMLGYEMLHKIKSRYDKENSVYFEDVFVRLESEADPQIKAELKSGLLKLKPTTLSEYNKGFWKKVEGFQIEEKVS